MQIWKEKLLQSVAFLQSGHSYPQFVALKRLSQDIYF